jgi:hypothetical protein
MILMNALGDRNRGFHLLFWVKLANKPFQSFIIVLRLPSGVRDSLIPSRFPSDPTLLKEPFAANPCKCLFIYLGQSRTSTLNSHRDFDNLPPIFLLPYFPLFH